MAKKQTKAASGNQGQENSNPRQQAFLAALQQMEKKFGENIVMKFSDKPKFSGDVLSTGSLTLDIALGIGGLPRGRIVEIYGAESSGKCVSADTYLLTEHGLMTIGELFVHEGFNTACTNKIEEVQVGLINEIGDLEKTSHFTWNNRKPVKRIRTHLGLTLEATHNHRIRVMNERGAIVWRESADVKIGDRLPIVRNAQQFGHGAISPDEAEIIGYLIADGSLSDKNSTGFSNNDPEVVEFYSSVMSRLSPAPIHSYSKQNSAALDHHIYSKSFRTALHNQYGLEYVKAAEKCVPLCIRQGNKEAQIGFLRGYYELECHIDAKKSTIEVTSASRLLLSQVQLMLLNLGMIARISDKLVKDVTYYRLTLSGLDYNVFGEKVGFRTTDRQRQYALRPELKQIQTNTDSIPFMGGILRDLFEGCDTDREGGSLLYDYMGDNPKAQLTYDRLNQIIQYFEKIDRNMGHIQENSLDYLRNLVYQHYYYDTVEFIEDDVVPTFDVVMPETHSFWSNGIASHNTSLMFHVIAEAQKYQRNLWAWWQELSQAEREAYAKQPDFVVPVGPDINILFVDTEQAINIDRAEQLGVDLSAVYVTQPDTAEDALTIIETAVNSGATDVIVLDSIAMLSPRAEIEGSAGDSHMGLQARLMSQAMRRLMGPVRSTKTLLLMTNQTRDNMNAMAFAPKTTTPGGRAVKFAASVRIELARIASIKETLNGEQQEVGITVKATVKKNKVAAPAKYGQFDIMYHEGGISKANEILDEGKKLGLIEQRGAFYRLNDDEGTLLGQGKPAARQYLRNNPELMQNLEKRIREEHFSGVIVTGDEYSEAGDSNSDLDIEYEE